MSSGKAAALNLSADEIDDILYLVRVNESSELQEYLGQLSSAHSCPVSSILESCIDPDNLNTPFHYCCANGTIDLLKLLISLLPTSSRRESLSLKNSSGNTPLHWASLNGHIDAVKVLTEAGVDIWVKNAAGNLPVFEAERAEKDEVVAVLLLAGGQQHEEEMGVKEGVTDEKVEERDGEGVEGVTSQMEGAGLKE